jgi:hypothetical protein
MIFSNTGVPAPGTAGGAKGPAEIRYIGQEIFGKETLSQDGFGIKKGLN